jgi:flagellar biosynthetic protein FliP
MTPRASRAIRGLWGAGALALTIALAPASAKAQQAMTPVAAPAASPAMVAASPGTITINLGSGGVQERQKVASVLQILATLTILTLAPSILMMVTSFTRIIIVLGFIRRAMATQEVPPTQVLVGLALFLTFFVMAPTWNRIQKDAIQPYFAEKIGMQKALEKAEIPLREFLFNNTRKNDLKLFMNLSGIARLQGKADVPTYVLVPAFMTSEIQTAFLIGFIIYVPFLIIDMVVSSILLSMGMMMLPPATVSLPFKVILFVLVDGWTLVVGSLARSFG